ncbi:MAG: hypothetical protein IANPNBLG_00977 [Bryobacteraceae bacterium]|nr:hypothetical protein [Bryobacteraceae bacterium]
MPSLSMPVLDKRNTTKMIHFSSAGFGRFLFQFVFAAFCLGTLMGLFMILLLAAFGR